MGILANHKIKIISSLVGTSVISAGVSIPYLTSNSSVEQEINHQSPEHLKPKQRAVTPTKMSNPIAVPQESIASKLAGLKNKKSQLSEHVGSQISSYTNMIKGISNVQKLEEELNKCLSRKEVSPNITEQEKKQLKGNYEAVKTDIKKYEEIQKQITQGELKSKESYADNYSESEERYKEFESEFNKVEKEYDDTVNKKSGTNLYSSFLSITSKLDSANKQCSFKDMIKMNDWIGQRS